MGTFKRNIVFMKGSKKYFFATLFLPPTYRNDVISLYNFSRLVDDFVDKKGYTTQQLEQFIEKFESSVTNNTQFGDEIVDNFIETFIRRELPYEWVDALFESIRADTGKLKLERLEDTLKYTYGVAEVIGLMVCKICKIDPIAYDHARYAGRAAQWANFLRDIFEDFQNGRTYLPKDEIDISSLGTSDIGELLDLQFDRYFEYRELAKPGYDYLPWYLEWSVRLSASVDDQVVKAIQSKPEISVNQNFKY